MNEHRGLWRGKSVDEEKTEGEWKYGYYVYQHPRKGAFGWQITNADFEHHFIITKGGYRFEIDPSTLGECTGLTDKNGKLIFEGDIVKFRDWHKGLWCWIGAVCYVNQGFVVSGNPNEECDIPFTVSMSGFASKSVEVIGDVYDNPGLLNENKT